MTRFKKAAILTMVGAFALLQCPSRASAGFLTGFTGNTQMSNDGSSDGIVNFSVYQSETANWVTELALGGSPAIATPVLGGGVIDTTARFVYFYQIVNNNPVGGTPDPALKVFKVLSGAIPYTSAGYLSATVFTDANGEVGPTTNQFLGSDGTKPDDVVDGTPSETNVSPVGLSSGTANGLAARAPTSASLGGAAEGGFAEFSWTPPPLGSPIKPNEWSTVVFLTSNAAPVWGSGDLRDGSTPSDGDVPVQGPEPSTLLLAGFGLAGLFGYRLHMQRVRPKVQTV